MDYSFETALSVGRIDKDAGVIHGVSVINLGEARGHGLHVDRTCMGQLLEIGNNSSRVPMRISHGSGPTETAGYITNFKIANDQLRGDLHLLKTHPQRAQILELAESIPGGVGLSCAFRGVPEELGGKKYARVAKLNSIDLVSTPAVTDGLFEEGSLDNDVQCMDNPTTDQPANEIEDLRAEFGEKLADLENFQRELVTGFSEVLEADEQDAQEEVDELTDSEIEAVIDELIEEDGSEFDEGSSEFEELQLIVETLLAEREAEMAHEEHFEFEDSMQILGAKLTALEELVDTLAAENEALKYSNLSGGAKPSTPTFLNAKNSEFKTQFEAAVNDVMLEEKKSYTEASEKIVIEQPALYQDYLTNLGAIS